MKYIPTNCSCVEFINKTGEIGTPTGIRTSGGAKAIFGDQEILSPMVTFITQKDDRNSHKFPFESVPVEVFGESEMVIFHFPITWDGFDSMRESYHASKSAT